jgi:hypothetical protein
VSKACKGLLQNNLLFHPETNNPFTPAQLRTMRMLDTQNVQELVRLANNAAANDHIAGAGA